MMIKARFVAPVDAPVIENGAVVVEGDRIAAIGDAGDLQGEPVVDYGDSLIAPGFVNAHTHLELGPYAGRVAPGPDLVDWLERLVRLGRAEPLAEGEVLAAVRQGATQSIRCGVTAVGDITSHPVWTRPALAATQLGGVSFGEVLAIGNQKHLLGERLDAAAAPTDPGSGVQSGISPHAPYTLEPAAMRACSERAEAMSAPVCIHLAEGPDERAFTTSLEGPYVDLLRRLEVWDDSMNAAGCGPVELADRTGLLGPRTVVAHANYVTDEDLDRIEASGASVAYCPRTHHAFGHDAHRFRDMLALGINVCLGTDSLVSNPSLSILDEVRFLRRSHRDLPAETLLAMATLHGARALGLGGELGSLTPGKSADLVVIPCDSEGGQPGWASVFEVDRAPIAVYVSGKRLQ